MSTDIPWIIDDPVTPVAPPVIAPDKRDGAQARKGTGRPKQARKRAPVAPKANGGFWSCILCVGDQGGEGSACPTCGTDRTWTPNPKPEDVYAAQMQQNVKHMRQLEIMERRAAQADHEPQVAPRPEPAPQGQATPDDLAGLDIRSSWAVPPPARKWLVDGWIPDGRIAMLAGRGAAGKSQISLQLAHAITRDLPNGGTRTWFSGGPEIMGGQGSVAFATWEDDGDEVLRRMLNNPEFDQRGAPDFDKDVGGRFHFLDLAGRGPLWAVGTSRQTFGELTPVGLSLRATCQTLGARLLVVDALSSAYAANENERPAVRAFLSSWDRWARDTGCCVLLVAHPSKNAEGVDASYSGSTDWRAGVRSLLVLSRPKGVADRGKLVCDKLNAAQNPSPVALGSPRWWQTIDVDPMEIDDADTLEIRESIVDAIKEHGPLNRSKIRAALRKGKTAVDNTLAKMEMDGSLAMKRDGNAKIYSLGNPDAPINSEHDIPF